MRTNILMSRTLTVTTLLGAAACSSGADAPEENIGTVENAVVDVAHTAVERQSIGNCWIYAEATWVESMVLSAALESGGGTPVENSCVHNECQKGEQLEASCSPCAQAVCAADAFCCNNEWDDICARAVPELCGQSVCEGGGGEPITPSVAELDVSQSYWTYWHWFDEITNGSADGEIETGGSTWVSHQIIRERGLIEEAKFVLEDTTGEMSLTQKAALDAVNLALKSGDLMSSASRQDGKLVRRVLDEAWGLSGEIRAELDGAFGEDGGMTLRTGANVEGTSIIDPATVKARYAKRTGTSSTITTGTLLQALTEWKTVQYPSTKTERRKFMQRVQRALHDRQPVVITWDVDFSAMENGFNERRGSFNMQTLRDMGGPGHQGGHMTVLEDYEVKTQEFGVLKAGVTLDPVADRAKLEAALKDSSEVTLLRIKNSWGADRLDRAFVPDYPGYHDLWMDYLNGPIRFCPDVEPAPKTAENCSDETIPLNSVMLPPGY